MAASKRGIWATAILLIFGAASLLVAGAVLLVHRAASGWIVANQADLPVNDVGLVLGTPRYTREGFPSPHFDNRVAVAASFYKAGKVRRLLLSGDGQGTRSCDEPAEMRAALMALGVPGDALAMDGAGVRTLDSVVRAREVFGLGRVTLITERFHLHRALFLARHKGLNAIACQDTGPELRSSLWSRVREYLANVKACLDLWVLRTRPRITAR